MPRHGRSYLNVGVGVYPPAGAAAGVTNTDVVTGTITLSGTRGESNARSESRSGQITLTGTRTDAQSRSESRSGTVFLTGTRVESFAGTTVYSDHPTGTITLTGLGSSAAIAGADPVLSWLRVREKPSLNQSVMVTTPTGKTYRWGEDDPVPEKSFHDLSYGSGMPGGFDQMTATLPRKPGVDYSDLELFSNIQVFDAGGKVTGEYRLDSAPMTAGDNFVITPNAVGYQAALEDRKDCAAVFVDIDMSHWGQVSSQYRINNPTYEFTDATAEPDASTGAPSVRTVIQLINVVDGPAKSHAMYDAGALADIGSIYYAWKRFGGALAADTGIEWKVKADSVDVFSSADSTADLRAAGPGTGTLTSTASDNRFAKAEFNVLGIKTSAEPLGINWTMLAIYGDHGLTKRGSESATTAKTLYASDIIDWIVDNFASPLTSALTTNVAATSFGIPMLEFRQATTAAEMIKQANRFDLYDWWVGPGKVFYYQPRSRTRDGTTKNGTHWLARVGPAKLEATGQTTERCITDVLVSYQAVDGTPKYVGPVGSGADTESATLHDSDTQNPANVAGLATWASLDMGQVSTAAAATQVGARFLEEINLVDHSGRAELTGHVMNDAGVLFPYSSVQAGDTISFLDSHDTSARRIIKATKGSNAVSIDLDAPPEGINILLERLGVQWTNLASTGAPVIKPPSPPRRPSSVIQ